MKPLCLTLALLPLACATAEPAKPPPRPAEHPPAREEPIGFFLSRLSTSVERWNYLKLEGKSVSERRQLHLLEEQLRRDARLRLGEVIRELESGPPNNRAVAAVALGFAGVVEAQSPLLAALDDPDSKVVANALLGLGLLALPDTPLAQICYLMRRSPDPYTRNNAALALKYVLDAGGEDDCAAESAREAVLDDLPGVRASAALILALTEDAEAMPLLGDLIYDDVPIVCQAAARALARLGREPELMGDAARTLVATLDRVDAKHRPIVIRELERLARETFGENTEEWRDWAYRLP